MVQGKKTKTAAPPVKDIVQARKCAPPESIQCTFPQLVFSVMSIFSLPKDFFSENWLDNFFDIYNN